MNKAVLIGMWLGGALFSRAIETLDIFGMAVGFFSPLAIAWLDSRN